VCVCVWVDCHFVSGEPTYNEFHAGDGKALPVIGKCYDKCDIMTLGFYFVCYNSMNDIVVLCFLI